MCICTFRVKSRSVRFAGSNHPRCFAFFRRVHRQQLVWSHIYDPHHGFGLADSPWRIVWSWGKAPRPKICAPWQVRLSDHELTRLGSLLHARPDCQYPRFCSAQNRRWWHGGPLYRLAASLASPPVCLRATRRPPIASSRDWGLPDPPRWGGLSCLVGRSGPASSSKSGRFLVEFTGVIPWSRLSLLFSGE